jgi:hypothetical protein
MFRGVEKFVIEDLNNKKMVFIGGPRQVGKTTLALSVLEKHGSGLYLNYDNPDDRERIRKRNWKDSHELLIFDEIHKWRGWKSWVKGIYDKEKDYRKILVTGSARLDVYRKGGDSLQGRYHYYRLHPYSLFEMSREMNQGVDFMVKENSKILLERGGFPEPLFSKTERNIRRWRKERIDRVIREDIFTLEPIRNLHLMEILIELLVDRVGSPVSLRNISEDLGVSPKTVAAWIEILEEMYVIFIVPPWHTKLSRAIKKEYKIYFYDWGMLNDEGLRLENFTASHLLKYANFLEDTEGEKTGLYFVRDRDGHEADFLFLREKKPEMLVEVKYSDSKITGGLRYFTEKINPVKSFQLVYDLEKKIETPKTDILPMNEFLFSLGV